MVNTAERLGVKYVIGPECAHSYGAIRWARPNLMGRSFKFEVVHILELLDQLRRDGQIPPGPKIGRRMTLHDPCSLVRRGGLLEGPRRLLDGSCAGFVEMEDAGITNCCCSKGGGASANLRAEVLTVKAFGQKLERIDTTGYVEAVVVPCANCRGVFGDGLFEHDRELDVISLGKLVAQTLAEPDSGDACTSPQVGSQDRLAAAFRRLP